MTQSPGAIYLFRVLSILGIILSYSLFTCAKRANHFYPNVTLPFFFSSVTNISSKSLPVSQLSFIQNLPHFHNVTATRKIFPLFLSQAPSVDSLLTKDLHCMIQSFPILHLSFFFCTHFFQHIFCLTWARGAFLPYLPDQLSLCYLPTFLRTTNPSRSPQRVLDTSHFRRISIYRFLLAISYTTFCVLNFPVILPSSFSIVGIHPRSFSSTVPSFYCLMTFPPYVLNSIAIFHFLTGSAIVTIALTSSHAFRRHANPFSASGSDPGTIASHYRASPPTRRTWQVCAAE